MIRPSPLLRHETFHADFPCHFDELVAAAHGLTCQIGSPDGHVLFDPEGDSVSIKFSLTNDGARSCSVLRNEFERSLHDLKPEIDF